MVLEELAAVSEQRPLRDAYKGIPLTGAQQSMLPSYRLASRFMNYVSLDEDGLVLKMASEVEPPKAAMLQSMGLR